MHYENIIEYYWYDGICKNDDREDYIQMLNFCLILS